MDEEALERSRHVMDEERSPTEKVPPRKKPPAWAPPVRTPPRKALTVWCSRVSHVRSVVEIWRTLTAVSSILGQIR